MRNRAFWRAVHSLTHPLSGAAIAALLLNDHLLRTQFPSWLTGKLGDFAWLVFAPFICAALFAWMIRGKRQEKAVGIVAFAFIGVWFALAKTTPPVHRWTVEALEFLLGYPTMLRIDPTDLLALPALLIGSRIWRRAANTPAALKPRAWPLMALGVMATVATSVREGPFVGIARLCDDNGRILAFAAPYEPLEYYVSDDGGMTWTRGDGKQDKTLAQCGDAINLPYVDVLPSTFVPDEEHILNSGSRLFRYGIGHVESSTDNGQTWGPEIDLSRIAGEARRQHYRQTQHRPLIAGPIDGLVDSQGNVVLAMGLDGVLVRPPDAAWRWVRVGNYEYIPYGVIAGLRTLVWDYVITAAFIVLSSLTIGRPLTLATPTRVGWIVAMWLFFIPMALPAYPVVLLLPLIFSIGSVFLVSAGIRIYRIEPRAFFLMAALSVGDGLLFVFPFVLWAYGTVPRHAIANLYAIGIGLAAVVASRLALKRRFPDVFAVRKIETAIPKET